VRDADGFVRSAYEDTLFSAQRASPRGNETREVLDWTCKLTDPRARLIANPERDLRVGYCAAKVAWDLNERDDPEPLLFWNPKGRWYIDDGRFYGECYGKRFMPSLRNAIKMLVLDRESRRATVPIWHPDDAHAALTKKNVPCADSFQLRIIDDKLIMQVTMRSSSIGVLPYDLFLFSTIHELCANELDAGLGPLTWHARSCHTYESEIDRRMRELLWWRSNRSRPVPMAPVPYTLAQAALRWAESEAALRGGNGPPNERVGVIDDFIDPFERLMIAGLPRGK
jgi:hypothetical protein